MKHTKGKWEIDNLGNGALLIAAAPELLANLVNLFDYVNHKDLPPKMVEFCNKVIREASSK